MSDRSERGGDQGEDEHGADLSVHVHNEDDGRNLELKGGRGTPIATVIKRLYEKLGQARQQTDRLRCEANGQDVFQFEGLTLGQYVEAGHCRDLRWLFSAATGGAC
jgi:hypothetical protein